MSYFKFKTYKTPKDLEDAITKYLDECIANDGEGLDPASLKIALKLKRTTLWEYRNLESHKEYHEIMQVAYDYIDKEAWKDIKYGKGNFGTFYHKCVNKMSEKTEVEHSGGVKMTMPSVTITTGKKKTKLSFDVGSDK